MPRAPRSQPELPEDLGQSTWPSGPGSLEHALRTRTRSVLQCLPCRAGTGAAPGVPKDDTVLLVVDSAVTHASR